ncbi:MAG: hypothetical protein AB7I59_00725 [Geminicoccaceae bacterium]
MKASDAALNRSYRQIERRLGDDDARRELLVAGHGTAAQDDTIAGFENVSGSSFNDTLFIRERLRGEDRHD